jgi:hypothetical protein
MIDWLRYFFAAAGPLMLCSTLQWPFGATRFLFFIFSLLCTSLGAFFGVVEFADVYAKEHEKTA